MSTPDQSHKEESAALNPGEAATNKRQRKQAIYIAIATVFGAVIGFSTGFFDQGDGHLFDGDWSDLKLAPGLAIGIALALITAFLALPLYGFRMLDDYQREHNLIAFTGAALSVIAGFPVWATLHAGGFTPAPHAFGVFAICYVSLIISYIYARWRV